MPHPKVRPLFASLAGASLCALLGLTACGGTERPPDIVLYLVDTLRQDHLGVYGYSRDTSPALDRLAEDCVVFGQAYSTSAWTKPSTASLMTGLDPLAHGARTRESGLPERVQLLSERLQARGYYTAGVVSNANVVGHWGFVQGYDEFHDVGERSDIERNPWLYMRAAEVLEVVREVLRRRPPDRPLFLYVHTIDPHEPYDPPAPFNQTFSRRPGAPELAQNLKPSDRGRRLHGVKNQYDGEIRYHDEEFGRLLDELREQGLYQDAMLWFLSDHGDEHLEHGRGGHGFQLFNEVVRIPMLLKLPGNAHAGTRVEAPVSLVDVLPTVLGVLGETPADAALPGVDLRGYLGAAPPESRPLYFDLDLNVGQEMELHVARGVLYEQYKYIEEVQPASRTLLFHVGDDPGETHDLLATHEEVAAQLRAMLQRHRAGHQGGLVLRWVGSEDAVPAGCAITLRTTGRFAEVDAVALEGVDRLEVTEDGTRMTLDLDLESHQDNLSGVRIQDVDGVRIQVAPPDAVVQVVSMEARGGLGELPVLLGVERRPGGLPQDLSPQDASLLARDLAEVFVRERRSMQRITPGLYVVHVPEPEILVLEDMPAEMRERLKALGYLQDD